MFSVQEGSPRISWVPVDSTSTPTLYKGQMVYSTGDGVNAIGSAAGASDTTNKRRPLGIVIGTNNRTQVFDSTNQSEKITAVITQAAQAAREYTGAEGTQWSKGDPQAFVQIAWIDLNTIIKATIFKTTLGTAPTELVVTTGSTDGLGFTSNAADFTPVADLSTSYCRRGANAGISRISDDTSTTVETNDVAFPQDIAVGDVFIRMPFRPIGKSFINFDSAGLFVNCAAGPATDYYTVHILGYDLSVAGREYVLFQFDGDSFCSARA